eukprot:4626340-Alexandrium_andersonii.AAC.1
MSMFIDASRSACDHSAVWLQCVVVKQQQCCSSSSSSSSNCDYIAFYADTGSSRASGAAHAEFATMVAASAAVCRVHSVVWLAERCLVFDLQRG